jgi:co-chaperonin GroES (HSP10)
MIVNTILERINVKYIIHSFRNAKIIFENDYRYKKLWEEIKMVLDGISDQDIINQFESSKRENQKSISDAINILIDKRLVEKKWDRQSPIFNDSEYRPNSKGHWWTLDFSKSEISIEVAFNHGEATAWNLIKPVLAGELNHVEKATQTSAGVIITATDSMKRRGNFDGSIGSYEKFCQYLNPLRNILTIPMIIIGLEAPDTFFIDGQTKRIKDISEYIIPKNVSLEAFRQRLESYKIAFNKTGIERNGKKIPMSLKVPSKKIGIMLKKYADENRTVLEKEEWNIIEYDDIHCDEELQAKIEKLVSML